MPFRRVLRLLSLDGSGGARSFSQLKIMKVIMHRIQYDNNYPRNTTLLPCEYFDIMGGSDIGGIFVIMFVKLRMSVDEAMAEFHCIVEKVYTPKLQPEERTKRFKTCMESILSKKKLPLDLKLDDDTHDRDCLGFVIAALEHNVTTQVRLRTYPVRDEPSPEVTVIEAALATCASLPEFLAILCGPRYERQPYIGASNSIGASNPVDHVIAEAYVHLGGGCSIISFLSLGSGHPGTISIPSEGNGGTMHSLGRLPHLMVRDCERKAQEFQSRIGHTQIYFRFSVEQGMQLDRHAYNGTFRQIGAQTVSYLKTPEIDSRLDQYLKQSTMSFRSGAQVQQAAVLAVHHIRQNIHSRMNQWLSGRRGSHSLTHSQKSETLGGNLQEGNHAQGMETRCVSLDSIWNLVFTHHQLHPRSIAEPILHVVFTDRQEELRDEHSGTLHTVSAPSQRHSPYSMLVRMDDDTSLEEARCEWELAANRFRAGRLEEARDLVVSAMETRARVLGVNHALHKDTVGLIEIIDSKCPPRIPQSLTTAYLLLLFTFVMCIIAIRA